MSDGAGIRAAPASLYLHFPFCVRRCHYCDFAVSRAEDPPVDAWLEAIEAELAGWFEERGWKAPSTLDTIFVGGGTPSLLGGPGMIRLGGLLARRFAWSPSGVEWTAESNPASLTGETLAGWREAGVSRISVGVQSFDDSVLRWLGRLHDAAGARQALERVRRAGFEHVNLDLIFGLPEAMPRDWAAEVSTAIEAGVTHVSTYGLTAERSTPLGRRVESGAVRLAGEGPYEQEFLAAAAALGDVGFEHYEVSNFALPGHQCRHNWHYWDGSDYLGIGPSAHSFVDGRRTWNVSRWMAYRQALSRGGSPREGSEDIGAGESRLERLWLALRTNRGVPVADPLLAEARSAAGDLLAAWRAAGWLAEGEALALTPAGWLRMDELVAALGARLDPAEDPV